MGRINAFNITVSDKRFNLKLSKFLPECTVSHPKGH